MRNFLLNLICVMLLICAPPPTSATSLSATIREDVQFYYRKLTTFPSKIARLRFSLLYFNESFCAAKNLECKPRLDFYTTETDTNLKQNCSADSFGQVGNENLVFTLPKYISPKDIETNRYNKENEPKCSLNNNTVHCSGSTEVQDFLPRHFAFSFGFKCSGNWTLATLRGLQFNISIQRQSNRTKCISVGEFDTYTRPCMQYFNYATIPNLFGHSTSEELRDYLKFDVYVVAKLMRNSLECHQHFMEAWCYLIVPQCDRNTQVVTHLCKEMCYSTVSACFKTLWTLYLNMKKHSAHLRFFRKDRTKYANYNFEQVCDYLPSKTNSITPCFFKEVRCKAPPAKQGIASLTQEKDYKNSSSFAVNSTVRYTCPHKFVSHKTNTMSVKCLHSGKWSQLPECTSQSLIVIVLPILGSLLVVFFAIVVWKAKRPKRHHPLRDKEYDAFVCFAFDADNDFVMGILKPNLEPEFQLFIHSIDFKPGIKVTTNILNAITNCNCAIIILSDAFVKSQWCREEFEFCYRESRNDPAFKLLIILMQPVEHLDLSECQLIGYVLKNQAYLEYNDKKLWDKISNHLREVKQKKPTDRNGHHDIVNEEEEQELFVEFVETVL